MRKKFTIHRFKGLRLRWLRNALLFASVIGMLCVLCVTAATAWQLYSQREKELLGYVETATAYFGERVNKEDSEYFDACVIYTQTCDTGNKLQLQFVDTTGRIVASSKEDELDRMPQTPDIEESLNSRGVTEYIGKDGVAGHRVMAVSQPLIATSGNVIGVLRFASQTDAIDRQICMSAVLALITVLVMIAVLMTCINLCAKSILTPVGEIFEKSKMIAGGSYGIQIQEKYNDELGELASTINEMSMKINQNEKTQTEFISSLSHELRTPLTAITGWSETLLQTENLDEGTRRGMKIIHREAGRLTEMVISLLDFTRIQDGRMTLNIEPTDLRSEFEDTVFMYGSRLESDGIHLEYIENEDDIPEVACDPQRMRQVFLNILDNASKHGGEGKRIDAQICNVDDGVAVYIRDYGPGIPEDEIPLVTKKFYKGSSKARGSGIGLAVCDEIVEMHGGQLILENAPGGGTLVTVFLPITQ